MSLFSSIFLLLICFSWLKVKKILWRVKRAKRNQVAKKLFCSSIVDTFLRIILLRCIHELMRRVLRKAVSVLFSMKNHTKNWKDTLKNICTVHTSKFKFQRFKISCLFIHVSSFFQIIIFASCEVNGRKNTLPVVGYHQTSDTFFWNFHKFMSSKFISFLVGKLGKCDGTRDDDGGGMMDGIIFDLLDRSTWPRSKNDAYFVYICSFTNIPFLLRKFKWWFIGNQIFLKVNHFIESKMSSCGACMLGIFTTLYAYRSLKYQTIFLWLSLNYCIIYDDPAATLSAIFVQS